MTRRKLSIWLLIGVPFLALMDLLQVAFHVPEGWSFALIFLTLGIGMEATGRYSPDFEVHRWRGEAARQHRLNLGFLVAFLLGILLGLASYRLLGWGELAAFVCGVLAIFLFMAAFSRILDAGRTRGRGTTQSGKDVL